MLVIVSQLAAIHAGRNRSRPERVRHLTGMSFQTGTSRLALAPPGDSPPGDSPPDDAPPGSALSDDAPPDKRPVWRLPDPPAPCRGGTGSRLRSGRTVCSCPFPCPPGPEVPGTAGFLSSPEMPLPAPGFSCNAPSWHPCLRDCPNHTQCQLS